MADDNWQDPLGTAAVACELLILMAAGVHLIDRVGGPGGIRDVRGSIGTSLRGGSRFQLDRGLLSRNRTVVVASLRFRLRAVVAT